MFKCDCSSLDFYENIKELLENGSIVPVYVSGNSMNPFLVNRRDVVWLKAFSSGDLKIGNIVLFRRVDGSLVLHRIVKVFSDGDVLVMGDAQNWSERVESSSLIAVVTSISRKGKTRNVDSLYWRTLNNCWRVLSPCRTIVMKIWFKIKR